MAVNKTKYFQIFKESYTKDFPCIKALRKGEKFAFSEICRSDFNISHGGKFDISRHLKTSKHLDFSKSSNSSRKLETFLKSDVKLETVRAEMLFTAFLIEHNVPLHAADHAGPLFRKMFPDSAIAKQYGSGRTKTTNLVKDMAFNRKKSIVQQLQVRPFSVSCDGSNDTDSKLYPIVVRFFNPSTSRMENTLLSVPNLTEDASGENISTLILKEFEKNKIPPENCIAFMADNAAVMQGKRNGVASFLIKKHENIICMGCACHLVNLASEKGAASLPINIDEIVVDIYYYLKKSAKRKDDLKKFQQLHDKEIQKILKHVCTRWLSLGRSLNRIIDQWDPLLSYFHATVNAKPFAIPAGLSTFTIPKKTPSDDSLQPGAKICERNCILGKRKGVIMDSKFPKKQAAKQEDKAAPATSSAVSREEKIFMFLSCPLSKAYCLFLSNIIPTFDKVNTLLQTASPFIHKLRDIYLDLLKELFCRFLKPSVMKNKDLLCVQYHLKENQKESSEVVIGTATKEQISKCSEKDAKMFLENVMKYYLASCDYVVNKFCINDAVLKNAEVANLCKLESAHFSSVEFFLNRFPCMLLGKNKNQAIDELQSQFCLLQTENLHTIMQNTDSIDAKWSEVGRIVGSDGLPKYRELSDVMLSVLLIPHSNADCERIFSMVKKNRTEFRSQLSNETLENVLLVKTQNSEKCFERTFTNEELTSAKKATALSLK